MEGCIFQEQAITLGNANDEYMLLMRMAMIAFRKHLKSLLARSFFGMDLDA